MKTVKPWPVQIPHQRILRTQIEDVVFHDPRRDDQDRLGTDLRRCRRVLDQFDQIVAEHAEVLPAPYEVLATAFERFFVAPPDWSLKSDGDSTSSSPPDREWTIASFCFATPRTPVVAFDDVEVYEEKDVIKIERRLFPFRAVETPVLYLA